MIGNLRRNCMGTTSFNAAFPGMRKCQDFIVYPVKSEDDAGSLTIQSDTRIGRIDTRTGVVVMSASHSGGAYFIHLQMEARTICTLSAEELLLLKAAVFGSAHGMAGTNDICYTDNSGAIGVFGSGS